MTKVDGDDLGRLLRSVLDPAAEVTPPEQTLLDRLGELAFRLETERFQLAVVGQFKRGKSTLLNALLGLPVLPTGVVPLTSVPTLIVHGDAPALLVETAAGPEPPWSGDLDGLRARLAELVTETGNPHNTKDVTRAEVAVPSALLTDGLVVIDTPGIGSAERHNTEAALAALPQCDAALVVLSPDPPITEAEIAYLAEVRRSAALIVPVLNKIDLVDGAERATTLDYLEAVLARIGIAEPVALVSSRPATLEGITPLTNRLASLYASGRRQLLAAAIARKAHVLVGELSFQNDLARAALALPVERLDAALAAMRMAADEAEADRIIAIDLTAGDRARLLARIDEEAFDLRAHAKVALAYDATTAALRDGPAAFAELAARSTALFEAAYREASRTLNDRLQTIASRAQERIAPLLDRVRASAADALGVTLLPAAAALEPGETGDLAWAERPAETMNPLPPGLLDLLLSTAIRARRVKARLGREAERLATVNAEHLRWTLRQRAGEALRSYDRELAAQLCEAARSTIGLVERLAADRAASAADVRDALRARDRRSASLHDVLLALSEIQETGRTGGET